MQRNQNEEINEWVEQDLFGLPPPHLLAGVGAVGTRLEGTKHIEAYLAVCHATVFLLLLGTVYYKINQTNDDQRCLSLLFSSSLVQ